MKGNLVEDLTCVVEFQLHCIGGGFGLASADQLKRIVNGSEKRIFMIKTVVKCNNDSDFNIKCIWNIK